MKLSCEWRVFATKPLISLAILGQAIALAYLWLERMQTQSIQDDAPACYPTDMLMGVLRIRFCACKMALSVSRKM